MDTLPPDLPATAGTEPRRTRALSEVPTLASAAATLLRTHTALAELAADDAQRVVASMRLVSFPGGATVIREGDRSRTGFMLLILSGEISVETDEATVVAQGASVVISVLGPGSLIGEMGVLDAEPRAASCVTVGPVDAAVLTRQALDQLIQDDPRVGARLMAAVSQRLADRLRATGQQVRMYARLVAEQHEELRALKQAGRG